MQWSTGTLYANTKFVFMQNTKREQNLKHAKSDIDTQYQTVQPSQKNPISKIWHYFFQLISVLSLPNKSLKQGLHDEVWLSNNNQQCHMGPAKLKVKKNILSHIIHGIDAGNNKYYKILIIQCAKINVIEFVHTAGCHNSR